MSGKLTTIRFHRRGRCGRGALHALTIILAVCAMFMAAPACADTLVTKDGRELQGRIVSQTTDQIVFDVVMPSGSTATLMLKTSDVLSITEGPVKVPARQTAPDTPPAPVATPRPASAPASAPVEKFKHLPGEPPSPPIVKYDGPTYYVIPLHGMVGRNVLARILERSLDDAARRKPTVVILDVNSPGGYTNEAAKIIDVLRNYNKSMRIVAYCDRTISAAAVLSMSAKEIYMKPGGVIGAALAFQQTGTVPEDISEKFQSIWRATARSSAECGGHNSLLAEGMVDNTLQLRLEDKDGKTEVVEGEGPGKVVKRKGRLLTMTAGEAVEYGLAAGQAEDYAAIGEALGMKGWTECKGLGTLLADYWDKALAKLEIEMKRLDEELDKNMTQVTDNRPEKAQYMVYPDGRFTHDSRELWQRQTTVCIGFLVKAQKNIKDEADLVGQYEELKGLHESLMKAYDNLDDTRKKLILNYNKLGPDK